MSICIYINWWSKMIEDDPFFNYQVYRLKSSKYFYRQKPVCRQMPALFSWINSCLFLSSEKWNKVESLLTSWQSLQCAPCQANISQIALRKLIIATLKWSGTQGVHGWIFLWNWLSHISHIVSVESGCNHNFLHQKRSNFFTQMTLSEKNYILSGNIHQCLKVANFVES